MSNNDTSRLQFKPKWSRVQFKLNSGAEQSRGEAPPKLAMKVSKNPRIFYKSFVKLRIILGFICKLS
jgi:hypothetical protein